MRQRSIRLLLAFVAWVLLPVATTAASSLSREDDARSGSAEGVALARATSQKDDGAAPTVGAPCSFGTAHALAAATASELDVAAPRDVVVVPARLSPARPRAPPSIA